MAPGLRIAPLAMMPLPNCGNSLGSISRLLSSGKVAYSAIRKGAFR